MAWWRSDCGRRPLRRDDDAGRWVEIAKAIDAAARALSFSGISRAYQGAIAGTSTATTRRKAKIDLRPWRR